VLHAAGDELPFSPEEDQLTAKVNPQTDTLLLKVVKRQNKQKFLRGVPLPPNLRLHHLRVKVLPQGEVMVKAPFLLPGEMPLSMSFRMAQENSSLPMPSWIPVRVSWKQPSRDEEVPLHFGSEEMRLVGERSGGWKRGEEEDSLGQHLRKEKKKKMQSTGGGWQEQECEGEDLLQRDERDSENITERESCSLSHSSEEEKMSKLMENMLRPQHIREEVGGEEQVSIILQVNALGFSPEEIRVRVVKEKKLLIVEATKEQQQKKVEMVEGETAEKLLQEESGVAVKYLRREFVLCDWVDVSKVGVRVLPGGLVNIKLPLVKSKQQPKLKPQPQKVKKNKDSHRGDCGMDDVYTEGRQRQQSVGDWEKPMFS
jgi:HSP20 family molecular chaperone IbpA